MYRKEVPGPHDLGRIDSELVRSAFVADCLFEPGTAHMYYTNLDRLVVGGFMPEGPLMLTPSDHLGTSFFLERREAGVINIGDPGSVQVNGRRFDLGLLDCLYIGAGESAVTFERDDRDQPAFYFVSCPAHRKLPTTRLARGMAETATLGDHLHCSKRYLSRYIFPGGLCSCQLVMGVTELAEGSVWNSIPPHTHRRRSEIYMYFGLAEDDFVVHLIGEADRTSHVILRDRQAVLAPDWSIHTGVGTRNYRFIWAMAGENQEFSDTDPVSMSKVF